MSVKDDCYRAVLSVIRDNRNDPDIFEAGKRFLSYPPRKKFMEDLAKIDPYWKEAIDFIEQPVPLKEGAGVKRPLDASPT